MLTGCRHGMRNTLPALSHRSPCERKLTRTVRRASRRVLGKHTLRSTMRPLPITSVPSGSWQILPGCSVSSKLTMRLLNTVRLYTVSNGAACTNKQTKQSETNKNLFIVVCHTTTRRRAKFLSQKGFFASLRVVDVRNYNCPKPPSLSVSSQQT